MREMDRARGKCVLHLRAVPGGIDAIALACELVSLLSAHENHQTQNLCGLREGLRENDPNVMWERPLTGERRRAQARGKERGGHVGAQGGQGRMA